MLGVWKATVLQLHLQPEVWTAANRCHTQRNKRTSRTTDLYAVNSAAQYWLLDVLLCPQLVNLTQALAEILPGALTSLISTRSTAVASSFAVCTTAEEYVLGLVSCNVLGDQLLCTAVEG